MSETPTTSPKRSRAIVLGAVALLALVIAGIILLQSTEPPRPEPAAASADATLEPVSHVQRDPAPTAPARPAAPDQGAAGSGAAVPPVSVVTPVPPVGTKAQRKVWVRSKYGDGPEQLGIDRLAPGAEGETYPPQGFTATPDGDLVVLDSAKKRLVWYGADGKMKRTRELEGLEKPADVGVAADGTLVVMDHEGVQTQGTLLLDAQGRRKGMLPQSGGGQIVQLDVVGNDIYGNLGLTSIKLGDTSGTPTHETPGLYDQDGTIPGHVGPDGRTVISSSIESASEGRFLISVLRDEPPQHVFTRQYSVPVQQELGGIYLVQADRQGTIYAVLYYDTDKTTLLCLDGKTGEPLGAVAMPMHGPDTGTPFREWSVLPDGGVVYQHFTKDASTFEIYDCR